MPAIMPFQENETSRSGRSAATTASLRLVLTRPAIVVGARAMFLLLLARGSAGISAGFAMLHVTATWISSQRLIAGDTVARRKLDFQLDDFVPLLIGSITFWDRQEVTQAATRIRLRRYGNRSFGRVFWIRIGHCNLKKAEPVKDEPRIP
jgi:hypothetical protein